MDLEKISITRQEVHENIEAETNKYMMAGTGMEFLSIRDLKEFYATHASCRNNWGEPGYPGGLKNLGTRDASGILSWLNAARVNRPGSRIGNAITRVQLRSGDALGVKENKNAGAKNTGGAREMKYGARNKSHHKYVVERAGKFLGFFHNSWHSEYPDAFIFDSLPEAMDKASRYAGASVIRDYGFETQETLFEKREY